MMLSFPSSRLRVIDHSSRLAITTIVFLVVRYYSAHNNRTTGQIRKHYLPVCTKMTSNALLLVGNLLYEEDI